MDAVINLFLIVLNAFQLLLFIYVILSWILPPYHDLRVVLGRIFEPFLKPIRDMIPQTGPFDFSVIVLFIILYILIILVQGLL